MAEKSSRKLNDSRRDRDDDDRQRSSRRDEDDDRPRRRDRDAEIDDADRPRSKNARAEDDNDAPRRNRSDDQDDRPRSRKRQADDEDDNRRTEEDDIEEERPRKKKKKKKKKYVNQSVYDDLENRSGIRMEDWMIAGFLFASGLVLCLISAIGIAGMSHAWKALLVMMIYFIMVLPLTIGALMGAGILMNIDYGEIKLAIVRLAGISAFNNGVIWMGDWIGIPFFITLIFCAIIGFGLFMALFELDVQETNISVAAINIVQFGARFILIGMAILHARHVERKAEREYNDRPSYQKKIDQDFGKGNGKGQMMEDDDPDDDPLPP